MNGKSDIWELFKGLLPQIFIAIISLAAVLAVIRSDVGAIDQRVLAIEERNKGADLLIERFLQLEERDKKLVLDVEEIKHDVKSLLLKK